MKVKRHVAWAFVVFWIPGIIAFSDSKEGVSTESMFARLHPEYKEADATLLELYSKIKHSESKEEQQVLKEKIFSRMKKTPISEWDAAYLEKRGQWDLFRDTYAGNVTYQEMVEKCPPLETSLGKFIPAFAWDGPLRNGATPTQYYQACYERGFLPLVAIPTPEAVSVELENIRVLREIGYPVAILGRGWFNVSSRQAAGEATHTGCYGMWKREVELEKPRLAAIIEEFKKYGIKPDYVFIDWESGNRATFPVHVERFRNDSFPHCSSCTNCQKNVDAQYLGNADKYIQGMEVYRVKVAREVLVKPFREYHPEIILGSYFGISHVRNDSPLPEKMPSAIGWYRAGWSFSQPVLYPLFQGFMRAGQKAGTWNTFKSLVERMSRASVNQCGSEYQVPWTCGWMNYPNSRRDFVPLENCSINLNDGKSYHSFNEQAYREMLRHLYLRGAKHLMFFWEPRLLGYMYRGKNVYLNEINLYTEVLNEFSDYYDVIHNGAPINLEDFSAGLWENDKAAVWSGAETEDQCVIRTKSFSYSPMKVTVRVFGEEKVLDAPPEGKTWIFNRGD